MKLIIIVLTLFFLAIQGAEEDKPMQEKWNAYKIKFQKQYKNEEEETHRMKIFINNMHVIEEHNKDYELGLTSYSLGENQFSDMTHEEFVRTFIRPNQSFREDSHNGLPFQPPRDQELPTSIDWRKKGAVTPVKDQGNCGSCWAFGSVGALEGHHFIKTGQLVNLSVQNLLDCVTENAGCGGGTIDMAYKYIQQNGIESEESYPYENKDAPCRYNPSNVETKIRKYVNIEEGNEEHLKTAVATTGPVAVCINTNHPKYQHYHGGIYDEPNCGNTVKDIDHIVAVVGYGTTDDGRNYWIVKESRGTNFGKDGYIYMSRNKNNQCAIATHAVYPLV